MRVRVLPGERIPVDGVIEEGAADLDMSLVTGESAPVSAEIGTNVYAGTLNLNGSLTVGVRAAGEETLLAEIVRLIEAAEQGRARYVRIADRVARFYSPMVHILALSTFVGWWVFAGAAAWPALTAAIAVLIITCPCALGLAVPAVQVAAVDRLLRAGVLVKSGDALERLAAIDTVVFDKTGTLTEGRPELAGPPIVVDSDWILAAALAERSRHPMARALAEAVGVSADVVVSDVVEIPGRGIRGLADGTEVRIGNRQFCNIDQSPPGDHNDDASEIWVQVASRLPRRLIFRDRLRADAASAIDGLRRMGLQIYLLSGDRSAAVGPVAQECGIDDWQAACLPVDKVAFLEAAKRGKRSVLMVGDGINDAPAIAAATVGMSPASGACVSQVASDLVFLGNRLEAVVIACRVARHADRLVKQNFVLAAGYNALAVPIAMAGLVTPLIAAIAMSSSSIIVTLNALRVRFLR
jgi:Cu2+-exporting ATPase